VARLLRCDRCGFEGGSVIESAYNYYLPGGGGWVRLDVLTTPSGTIIHDLCPGCYAKLRSFLNMSDTKDGS
jgi:hypothetical protein